MLHLFNVFQTIIKQEDSTYSKPVEADSPLSIIADHGSCESNGITVQKIFLLGYLLREISTQSSHESVTSILGSSLIVSLFASAHVLVVVQSTFGDGLCFR